MALRKQIETTSIFFRNPGRPETNSTNHGCDYVQTVAAALRLRYVALRCVTECLKPAVTAAADAAVVFLFRVFLHYYTIAIVII